jgi:hypothetical protein
MSLQTIINHGFCICIFLSSIHLLMTEIQENYEKRQLREKRERDLQIYVLYKFRRNVFLKKRQKITKILSISYPISEKSQLWINYRMLSLFHIVKPYM